VLCVPVPAWAAPFTPRSEAEVVETVPARATDPAAREMQALRQAWRSQPQDLAAATRLAWRYQQEVAATGDPRYVGYVEATLRPWWALPDPPPEVRVLRAVVRQFDHQFDPALADLRAVLEADPGNVRALAWQLAIQMVRADYRSARTSCEQLAPLVSPLVGAACRAQVEAATGRAGSAAAGLRAALLAQPRADAAERLWSLTRLAEIEVHRGDAAAAQAAFEQALSVGLDDVYLQAAYADHLLDQGRPAEVVARLKDRARADVLLLRLALAAKAAGDPGAAASARELQARFDAARLRGDTSHRKEEARHALALRGDVALALRLARENWAEQREPADARVLLEAAVAARDRAAALPVLQWLADSGFDSVPLRLLADRVKSLP
jgi:predicted Zn-dependent protease